MKEKIKVEIEIDAAMFNDIKRICAVTGDTFPELVYHLIGNSLHDLATMQKNSKNRGKNGH